MSAGPETRIHAALMARVETLSTSLPISYPGVTFDPPAGDHLRVSQLRNEPVRWALDGGMPMDRMGFLQIDLFTRVTNGSYQVTADAQAEEIAEHFPRDLRLTSGGETITIIKAWPMQGRKDPNGTHWHTPIRIEYRSGE